MKNPIAGEKCWVNAIFFLPKVHLHSLRTMCSGPIERMCNVLLDQSRDHFKTQDLLVISWVFFNLNVPFSII